MSRDRREELGLDPNGLRSRACPTCGQMMEVRTERGSDGARRYFCSTCDAALGEEANGSFEAPLPDYPDA